jgi:hypothetical protein
MPSSSRKSRAFLMRIRKVKVHFFGLVSLLSLWCALAVGVTVMTDEPLDAPYAYDRRGLHVRSYGGTIELSRVREDIPVNANPKSGSLRGDGRNNAGYWEEIVPAAAWSASSQLYIQGWYVNDGIVMGLALLFPLAWVVRHRLGKIAFEGDNGRCPFCNYDLRGWPHLCPECGKIPPWRPRKRRRWRRRARAQ